MDPIAAQTLQLEIIGIGVAFIGALAALGRWMITFHKRTIEQAIKDARSERAKLEAELRSQITKLEARIEVCEERWLKHVEKHVEETKQ